MKQKNVYDRFFIPNLNFTVFDVKIDLNQSFSEL